MTNDSDEVVIVKLPRSEYERLRSILERERTYNWLTNRIRSTWVWVFAGGLLTFVLLYEKFFTVVK